MSDKAEERFDVELTGCRPEPLASYLKALGVLRLVAEQKDKEALGLWRGEVFVVRSTLDRDALVRFFVKEWQPTPVVAPWNGGSGFYPKDNSEAADGIVASKDERLGRFAQSIGIARAFIAERGWSERPADDDKRLLLSAMRARLPDEALAWLDAAVVVGDDRLLFPPLLGTGGNDGRLDFSNNFQQRVMEVTRSGMVSSVESSLFGTAMTSRFKGAMGQYQPAANERTNPWDFILLIEGALMFAAAATRRYESASPSTMAFPFHARAAGGVSTVTDSDEGESRDELWLPLWSSPTTVREVRRLFAEGRATVGSGDRARPATSALDFARAVTALGVDRGIDGFVRVGFHVRNGLAYFATPLGRFATREVSAARLLDDVDAWYQRFRQKSVGKTVPARIALARRRLEQSMFEGVTTGGIGPVLLELADAERALVQSLAVTKKALLRPIPVLPATWAVAAVDGSVEQRLAAALAARAGMRGRLTPLDLSRRGFGRSDEASFVFTERPLVDNLHALLLREDVEAMQRERAAIERAGPARWKDLKGAIAFDDKKPVDRPKFVATLARFDVGCLLHGVFLESIAGVLRLPRALSGFIEAEGVSRVNTGGVKNDRVQASKDEEGGRTAAEGFGNVPFHRTEFVAEYITAYFNLDLDQLRGYRLGVEMERLLLALALFKVQKFLGSGLRLRTACDFAASPPVVKSPSDIQIPSLTELESALPALIQRAQKHFASPPVTTTVANREKKAKEAKTKKEQGS